MVLYSYQYANLRCIRVPFGNPNYLVSNASHNVASLARVSKKGRVLERALDALGPASIPAFEEALKCSLIRTLVV